MMRILTALFLAALSFAASAEVWQGRYGVAETFPFKLYNADGTLDVDEADGGTEVSLSCDEGAETTATNDFVDEGTFYSIALTAAEMRCERVAVVVAATTTEVFFIQTNGAAGVIDEGTAQAATGTTLQLRSAASFADDEIIGATCIITGGSAGVGQARTITDYVSSTDTATVATWTTTPTGTITYQCHGTAAGSGLGDGSTLTSIPWNSAWDAEVQSEAADAINADTGDSFTAVPWNASWDAEVQSEATDALNAYDPPTRAELTSDIAGLDTLLDTIAGYIDTEIATLLDGVDIESINDVAITGDGSGTPFNVTP